MKNSSSRAPAKVAVSNELLLKLVLTEPTGAETHASFTPPCIITKSKLFDRFSLRAVIILLVFLVEREAPRLPALT